MIRTVYLVSSAPSVSCRGVTVQSYEVGIARGTGHDQARIAAAILRSGGGIEVRGSVGVVYLPESAIRYAEIVPDPLPRALTRPPPPPPPKVADER